MFSASPSPKSTCRIKAFFLSTAEASFSWSGPRPRPFSTMTTSSKATETLPVSKTAPDLPSAARIRPQFASSPKQAVLKRLEFAMVLAALSAASQKFSAGASHRLPLPAAMCATWPLPTPRRAATRRATAMPSPSSASWTAGAHWWVPKTFFLVTTVPRRYRFASLRV